MTAPLRALLSLALVAAASPAAAAERNYSVTGFDRIRVDGPFKVALTTGVAPFARASGSAAAIDAVTIDVQGRTLVVGRNRSSAWSANASAAAGPIAIAVGTHDLTAAFLNGAGRLAIDRVKGLSFDLSVQGAGAASIGDVAVDQMKVGIAGSGGATLAGSAAKLTAIVRGLSSLDGAALSAKDATVGAEGAAMVRLTITGTAKVEALGTATIELSGNPACTAKVVGSASVTGCR